MSLTDKIKRWRENRKFRRWMKKNEWHGFLPGDIVEYKDTKYLYMFINPTGGPGNPGMPEPVFRYADPVMGDTKFYLRVTGGLFPEEVFGEQNPPNEMMEADITPLISGEKKQVPLRNLGTIAFLNATPYNLKKVGHYTPDEWNAIMNKAKEQLRLANKS